MLFLFRKIRLKLISTDVPAGKASNKIITYLLYAVGEIILVVVGILIAVQIDDWNEQVKKTKLERKVLQEILVDLDNELGEINNELENYVWVQQLDSALEAFYFSDLPFSDSIESFIYGYEISPHFNPINGGYQLLKVNGIDLVSNDSLRIVINTYYEQIIPYYLKYESERIHTTLNEFIPFNNQNFLLKDQVLYFPFWKRVPFDENAIRSNKQWLAIIQKSRNLAHTMVTKGKYLKSNLITLRNLIKAELDTKK